MDRINLRVAVLNVALIGWLGPAGPLWAQLGEPGFRGFGGFGQGDDEPVVSVTGQFTAPAAGEPARLFVTATMEPGWHIYSITQAPGGVIPSKIYKLAPSAAFRLLGAFQASPPPKRKPEPLYDGLILEEHYVRVVWHAPIELASGVDPASLRIQGALYAQACKKACIAPRDYRFTATLGPGIAVPKSEASLPPGVKARQPGPAAVEFRPEEVQAEEWVEATSLWTALLFAFGGGLILNVMPCVLPVIGLKILAFFNQAGKSRRRAFVLNVWYAAGLLSVFLVLAALSVGLSEMFTEELFGIIMAAVIFAMALSLMGVWELQVPSFLGSGKTLQLAQKEGAAGAFFKGIITTLLAIPCGAPLLSPALKWAEDQVRAGAPENVYLAYGVIGLGMATPYLVIGAFPELLRFLPKPGAWMETFQKLMGYLLLVAVVWILYFLPIEDVVPTVGLLFGLWLACWLIGRLPVTAPPRAKAWGWGLAVLAVGLSALVCFLWLRPAMQHRLERRVAAGQVSAKPPDASELPWQPFDRASFERLVAENKTILIDFTADWCLTCKTLEAWVLNTRETRELVDRNGVVTLQADWTNGRPEVTEMMRILGSKQVPVVAIFPAGDPSHPIVLRGGYGRQTLLEAIERAGPSAEVQPASAAISSG